MVIAEAGVNHNGDLGLALEMVDAAAFAGADVVKFQTFKATRLASAKAEKAAYQKRMTDAQESQFEMLRRLELDERSHHALIARCAERKITFLSTAFDEASLAELVSLGMDRIKIPSGEITNGPLLLSAASTSLPVILSTGMSTTEEIARALRVLAWGYLRTIGLPNAEYLSRSEIGSEQKALFGRVTLLHCTTEYPAPPDDLNLRAISTLREQFGLPVGFSDHSEGITAAIAAAALGATVIEKHFTLDRSLPGPDQAASLEVDELKAMVAGVRMIERAMGSGVKHAAQSEKKNISVARKSVVASCPIRKGERFCEANLTAKRPGSGRSPMEYWSLLGQVATRDYEPDEMIE